jgi:hypothetical protein
VLNLALRHEDVWGSACTDPRFPDLGTSWRCVVIFTLYPREKIPIKPLDRRVCGPRSQPGRCGGETILDYRSSNPTALLQLLTGSSPQDKLIIHLIPVWNSTARLIGRHMRSRTINVLCPPPSYSSFQVLHVVERYVHRSRNCHLPRIAHTMDQS